MIYIISGAVLFAIATVIAYNLLRPKKAAKRSPSKHPKDGATHEIIAISKKDNFYYMRDRLVGARVSIVNAYNWDGPWLNGLLRIYRKDIDAAVFYKVLLKKLKK